jgi:hypothetical protein
VHATIALAAIATFALAVLAGCSPSVGADAAPDAWQETQRWEGTGAQDTDAFTVRGQDWRLSWLVTPASPEDDGGNAAFSLHVYRDGEDVPVDILGDLEDEVSVAGSTVLDAGPGTYYLRIEAAMVDWTVTLAEHD